MVKVYAHDSGQRYNWAYSLECVRLDREEWVKTVHSLNNMPLECIGKIELVDLSEIDESDVYVGGTLDA